jgi:thiol-disulfide isomerase/thioredoxin
MRRGAIIMMLLALPGAAFGQVKWEKSLEAGSRAAARSGKPVLLDFYATWCGPCRRMEEETFADPAVKALMGRVVCVRLDIDRQPVLADRYGVSGIPRILVLPAKGGQPLLDTQGFSEARPFAQELRKALGLQPRDAVPSESPGLARVRQALGNGSYAALKASDPQAAASGLDKLVVQLGVLKESNLPPVAALIRGAGDDAVPALLRGMNHRYLAVRAGAYRAFQSLLRERGLSPDLPFDPWAAAPVRQGQLQRWTRWWKTRR